MPHLFRKHFGRIAWKTQYLPVWNNQNKPYCLPFFPIFKPTLTSSKQQKTSVVTQGNGSCLQGSVGLNRFWRSRELWGSGINHWGTCSGQSPQSDSSEPSPPPGLLDSCAHSSSWSLPASPARPGCLCVTEEIRNCSYQNPASVPQG